METILQVRYLALLLLAFAGYAQAADIAVTRCWQPDGPYAESGKCPAQISGAAAPNPGQTSFVLGHNTTAATTTTYYYTLANPSGAACTTLAPTRKAHISGAGATVHSTTTLSGSGPQTKTISGLTAGTAYCTFILQMTGYRASNRLTLAVQTLPETPTTIDMELSGYFIGTGGCTNRGGSANVDGATVTCNGTAHGRRFAHFGVLPTTATEGTDIWVLDGSTHAVNTYGKVSTRWGGSSADPTDPGTAYIGCYYLDPGDSDTPTACWEGTEGSDVDTDPTTADDNLTVATDRTMPIILGALTDACLAADNCNWTYAGGPHPNECTSPFQAIFNIKHSFVTVRGLAFSKSRCRAVTIDPDGDVEIKGVRFRGNVTEKSGYQATVLGKFVRQSVLKGNIFRSYGRCVLSRQMGGTQEPDVTGSSNCAKPKDSGFHSGGVPVSGVPNAYVGIVDNTFLRANGEGMQCLKSTKVWFKGNRLGNMAYSPNYLDACVGAVTESNVFWSTQGDLGQTNGRGFNSNTLAARTIVEHKNGGFDSINSVIRNNLFSYMGTGYVIAKQSGTTAADRIGISLYHNTFIGARQALLNLFSPRFSGSDIVKIDVRNNILQGPDGTQGVRCYAASNAEYDYNLWGVSQIRRPIPNTNPQQYDTACQGANDVGGNGSVGNPGMVLNSGASWEAFDWANPPDPNNARLVADTNLGADLNDSGSCTSDILDADLENWATIAHEMDYPYSLDADANGTVTSAELATWKQCAGYDFWGNVRDNAPNIGMHEVGEPIAAAGITISSNGRYFEKNGSPKIIVGCTGWLVKNLTTAKITEWLEAEDARGCDMVNAGIPIEAPEGGWPPFSSVDPICTDTDTTAGCDRSTTNPRMRTSFFEGAIDHLVEETARLGMNVAIPLMWGSTIDRVLCANGFTQADPTCVNKTRANNYTRWVVRRYAAYSHITWLVAGEYSKIVWFVDPTTHVVTQKQEELDANQIALLNGMAATVVANKHPDSLVSIHPDGQLYTYTPANGSSRGHFSDATWLDFSSLQAANNNINRINTERDYSLTPVMPVLQSEAGYESSNPASPDDSPWHTRMAAWTHVLSGGAGFIYGHLQIWDFDDGWEEYLPGGATPAAGAEDIYEHFADFWATHHADTNVPDRTLCVVGGGNDCGDSAVGQNTWVSILRSSDSSKMFAYIPKGNNVNINTAALSGTLRSRWFNPRTGAYTAIADPQTKSASFEFNPPGSPAEDNDYVLVID